MLRRINSSAGIEPIGEAEIEEASKKQARSSQETSRHRNQVATEQQPGSQGTSKSQEPVSCARHIVHETGSCCYLVNGDCL
jgi:hypothetical protein